MVAETPAVTLELPRGRRPSPRIAQLQRTFYFLRRNTLAMVGLAIILLMVAVAFYGATYPASNTDLTKYCATDGNPQNCGTGSVPICTYTQGTLPTGPNCYQTPVNFNSVIGPTIDFTHFSGGALPLGSLTLDAGGFYFFSVYEGLIKGAQWSMLISASIVATGALIGLLLGAVSGYFGGLVDETIMRLTDIFLSIPGLLLVIVVLAVFSSQFTNFESRLYLLIGAFVVTWWPTYARIVRGQVLVVREQRYVEAARASGSGGGRIVRKHIIPNSVFPVFVQMSLDVGAIPLIIAAIVFLGFKVFPSQYFPEWGNLAALPISNFYPLILYCQTSALNGVTCVFPWWQYFFPGAALFFFAISVNFFSDGLRDALDPRLRR